MLDAESKQMVVSKDIIALSTSTEVDEDKEIIDLLTNTQVVEEMKNETDNQPKTITTANILTKKGKKPMINNKLLIY